MNIYQTSLIRLLVAATFLTLSFERTSAGPRDGRANDRAPLVAVLAPHEGAAFNAATLHVQALLAAFKPHSKKSFVFNGQIVAGRNAGRISRVEIALDGVVVERIEIDDCRRQVVVDSRLDIGALPDGPHSLMVTAFEGHHRTRIGRSVRTTFTVDRSLPMAVINRVEEAATPKPFACLAMHGEDDEAGEDDDDDLDLEGRIVLGAQSDGVDLTRDRVIIALGSHLTLLEPGMLRCEDEGPDERDCSFEDPSQPLVQEVELKQKGDGTWHFKIKGGVLPPASERFYLRIGNDWGGIDLQTGELLATLRVEPDLSHRAQASIGTAGGSIQTTDANGVVIRLDIPADALTRETVITVTPLLSSPVPDASTALHPGVKFAPAGLVFAAPATLTLDFSATGQEITDDHFIFLLTSPLTALPLFGQADPVNRTLTTELRHFSSGQGGAGNTALTDPAAWANQLLASAAVLTLEEIRSVFALAAFQQQAGCASICIDMPLLHRRALESLEALISGPVLAVAEIRSEQLPGVRANFLPGGSGDSWLPYIMVGARQDGRLYVGVTVQKVPEIEGLALPFAAGLREQGETSASAMSFGDNTEVTISRELGILPVTVDYDVVVGVDLDNNGVLAGDETIASMGTVKAVSNLAYETARVALGALHVPGLAAAPYGTALLGTFILGTPSPLFAVLGPISEGSEVISFNQPQLSHNTGVDWKLGGTGTIPQIIFSSDSFLSSSLLSSDAFAGDDVVAGNVTGGVVVNTLRSNVKTIADYFFVHHPTAEVHAFELPVINQEVQFGPELAVAPFDPFLAIQGSRFTGTLLALVKRTGHTLSLDAVHAQGSIRDLYDFQFNLNSANRVAAIVQAGFPTLGNGGRIFRTVVNIEGTRTDISFDFCEFALCGLVVTPAAATVPPGGTVRFAAISGTPNPQVTWSASGGGTIDQTGLFTAGTAAGPFSVRATAVANGDRRFAEATVTVTVIGRQVSFFGADVMLGATIHRAHFGGEALPVVHKTDICRVIVAGACSGTANVALEPGTGAVFSGDSAARVSLSGSGVTISGTLTSAVAAFQGGAQVRVFASGYASFKVTGAPVQLSATGSGLNQVFTKLGGGATILTRLIGPNGFEVQLFPGGPSTVTLPSDGVYSVRLFASTKTEPDNAPTSYPVSSTVTNKFSVSVSVK